MDIDLQEIPIRDIVAGYVDNQEDGVIGYDGKLNIRPAYQREFVYDDAHRKAVIDTITKNFPLNVMYWVVNKDGTYELMDGQQRTVSFCQYVNGDFSFNNYYFHNLTEAEKNKILDYKVMVYFCAGDDRERLDWFKTINIAGIKLEPQELRNAIYTGPWLTDAKRYFSKSNSPAQGFAGNYLTGAANRQAYLETALKWISAAEGTSIDDYMARHQDDTSASNLWIYFQNVINWTQTIFNNYRREMKGLDWGLWYNEYKDNTYNPAELEEKVKVLMMDDEIRSRKGIYEYLLTGKESVLSLRTFSDAQKRQKYEEQEGICPHCVRDNFQQTHYEIEEMEGDHIIPWCDGGKTELSNCQMLCRYHNRIKSNH